MDDTTTCTDLIVFHEGREGAAVGRNGSMRVKGLRAWRSLDRFDRSVVSLEPVTSRGHIGNCCIIIPTADIAELAAMLARMAGAPPPAAGPVIVTVEGGVVQDVSGIPRGMTVEIHDYDVDGADCDEGDLERDADGDLFATDTWQGRED